MDGYFSFGRFITRSIVKALYFLGFLLLTFGGFALAVWAGLRLQDASISRQLGWRYVAIGIGAVIVGNLLWRIFCEFWIVLFKIYARLVAIDRSLSGSRVRIWESAVNDAELSDDRVSTYAPVDAAPPASEGYESDRPSSVLGLT